MTDDYASSLEACIIYVILFCVLTPARRLPFCSGVRNLTDNCATILCV